MSKDTRRFMRLLVFFDLPTVTKADKKAYVQFRRFLIQDGYDMIQWSMYGRIVNGFDSMGTHFKRLTLSLPPSGSVRSLWMTEKQFASMKLLVGLPTIQEKRVDVQQLVLL